MVWINKKCYCPCPSLFYSLFPEKTTYTNTGDGQDTIYWIGINCRKVVDGIPNVCRKDIVNSDKTVSYVWGYRNGVTNPDLGGYIVQETIDEFSRQTQYLYLDVKPGERITSRDLISRGYYTTIQRLQTLLPDVDTHCRID